jgi:subtilase family serine protease
MWEKKETCGMQAKPNYLRTFISTLVCSVLLAAVAYALPGTRNDLANAAPTDQAFKAHLVQIQPVLVRYSPVLSNTIWNATTTPQPVHFACQSNSNPQPSLCYGPYQIRQAYNLTDLLARQQITGKGSSITIIDAYGSPNIRKDLRTFNATWGLPNARFNVIAPYGVAGTDSAWISETSLDVEWAHVMAPGATINLVVAKDSNDVNIYKVLAYAVKHNLGDVISLSFGENEKCVDPQLRLAEHRVFNEATSKGMTLLAATGDFGSAQLACDSSSFERAVSFPSDDPLVTAVGGTALVADAVTGQYIRETAWNESSAYNKATGGGYSTIYRVPDFQRGLTGKSTGRAVPDISLNASVNGGVIVLESHRANDRPTINIMGGTSAAAPELAGILADGVQMAHHRLGPINQALYKLGTSSNYPLVMNDIASGDNILLSSGLNGYKAHRGWDATTGWGSPRNTGPFLQALINADTSVSPVTGAPIVPITGTQIQISPVKRVPSVPTTGTPMSTTSKKMIRGIHHS